MHYCKLHEIVVPANFDAPKSSDKFAIIDITERPYTLIPRTTFLESDVIRFIQRPENHNRRFRILDFKRGVTLVYPGGKKLSRMGAFDRAAPDGLLSLVARAF